MPPPQKIVIKPIIISNSNKMVVQQPNRPMFLSKIKLNKPMFKEDVIYESDNCDFLKGESQKVRIVNRVNLVNKTCRTIARCTSKGVSIETTSDDVCALIGQNNYDTILSALGSVFNEETKVRGILALLKKQTTYNTVATETDVTKKDQDVQTMESRVQLFFKEKQRKRIRKQQFAPYIVKDHPTTITHDKVKRIVVNLNDVKKEPQEKTKPDLPDLKLMLDEDSNMSNGSGCSLSSLRSAQGVDLLTNCQGVLKEIDKHTERITDKTVNSTIVTMGDGTNIMIPVKPQDKFHIATADILRNVTKEEGMKLIRHQADIDFKLCLEQDDDGYYPLHVAVLHNDVDLVRRQCLALRFRHESVDIPAGGLTALHMSIRQNTPECTIELLRNGADPLHCDGDRRTALHLCAEAAAAPLRSVLEYIDTHARQILKNNGDLWKPELESKSDEELTSYLYDQVSQMFDDQGYNPLMIAAVSGVPSHVSALAERAPRRVDTPAPSCGSTALYRAVAAACHQSKESDNRLNTPENYLKTVEILVEHGADPSIPNNFGSSVNTLLTEFNICALSMIIANTMTAIKHGNLDSNMILYKDKKGRIGFQNINGIKEINEIDVKPFCVGELDVKTLRGSKVLIAVDKPNKPIEKVYKASKFINSREAVKNGTAEVSKDKIVSLNLTTDKMTGLKVIKADQVGLDDKTDKRTDKVVIVENVKLKKDFPKIAIASTSVVKNKDFVLKNPIKLTKVKCDNINITSSLSEIEPVVNDVSNAKKRKLDEAMK